MIQQKHLWGVMVLSGLLFFLINSEGALASEQSATTGRFAEVAVQGDRIEWHAQVDGGSFTLSVSGPENAYYLGEFRAGSLPYFQSLDNEGNRFPSGKCVYQLEWTPASRAKARTDDLPSGRSSSDGPVTEQTAEQSKIQSGSFFIEKDRIISEEASVEMETTTEDGLIGPANPDYIINDDVIITGSECVGFDCANGEDFGFCTQIYKEHNLQICFNDTSYTASYARNDWKIQINDTTNGGASYFTIWDTTGNTRPFTIEAGAPNHSLYVDDGGRVGLGTSNPYVELHVKDGDTPTLRLDQDTSSGFAAQSWDVAGNETNFFIRDVTNGSMLPFRIQPRTPSSTLCLSSNGYVGVGTWSPGANLHVYADASNTGPLFLIEREGCDKEYLTVKDSGDVELLKTIGEGSDRNLKKNIKPVDTAVILEGIANMPVSTWNYKVDPDDVVHMGPMAQDFHAAFGGLGKDDKHISSLDASGVSFAAIQELNKRLEKQSKMIQKQNEIIQKLQIKIAQLERQEIR